MDAMMIGGEKAVSVVLGWRQQSRPTCSTVTAGSLRQHMNGSTFYWLLGGDTVIVFDILNQVPVSCVKL